MVTYEYAVDGQTYTQDDVFPGGFQRYDGSRSWAANVVIGLVCAVFVFAPWSGWRHRWCSKRSSRPPEVPPPTEACRRPPERPLARFRGV
ncbi:hypothetical protein BRC84_05825 [Halobacteriales archaeon QS_1_68_44]|nr:MAG: hypothetical protein BRC84_05825 [Halobacteriales archaeon QS_1_68_44]